MNSVTREGAREIRIGAVTALDLLLDCLRAAGVHRVFGLEPGIDPTLLELLADADGSYGLTFKQGSRSRAVTAPILISLAPSRVTEFMWIVTTRVL